VLLVAAYLACPVSSVHGGEFVGFRSSYQNFNLGRVAKSTLLDGGGVVDVVRDELSGSLAIGGEYLNIADRFIYSLSFDYSAPRLAGNSPARYDYRYSDIRGEIAQSQSIVSSQVARMSLGVGYNVLSVASTFVYLNPSITFEWGSQVTLDDAINEFVANGLQAPPELRVDAQLQTGFDLRLFSGVALSENVSIALSPSCRYGWDFRQRATHGGLVDEFDEGRQLSFGFEIGLYRAIVP